MTDIEALGLRRYDRIRVRKSGGRRRLALVMGTPTRVGDRYTLVPYSLVVADDPGAETISRHEYVLTLGGGLRDQVERA